MKQLLQAALVVLLVVLASCGGESSVDKSAAVNKEMLEVLSGITDKASAEAAAPKITELSARGLELANEALADPQKMKEQAKNLTKEEREKATAHASKMDDEMRRLMEIDGVMEIVSSAMAGAVK